MCFEKILEVFSVANSKRYQTFNNRMLHFDDDIEYVDVLYASLRKSLSILPEDALFQEIDSEKHPKLSRYKVCDDNRLLVFHHLKSTVYSAYIKELYEEFTMYLKGVMQDIYLTAKISPDRIVGEHRMTLSANDILKYAADGTIATVVIDSIFQTLENERSTISLITKVCKKLGLDADKSIVDTAVYYLEIRHKLVHTDGYADAEFRTSHPTLRYTGRNYIDLTYQSICDAKSAVFELVAALDRDAIEKGLLFA